MHRRFTTGADTRDYIAAPTSGAFLSALRSRLGRLLSEAWRSYLESAELMHRYRYRWPPF